MPHIGLVCAIHAQAKQWCQAQDDPLPNLLGSSFFLFFPFFYLGTMFLGDLFRRALFLRTKINHTEVQFFFLSLSLTRYLSAVVFLDLVRFSVSQSLLQLP